VREVEVKLYDDLDYAESGRRTEAAVTVTVGLNGTWRELDLSEEHGEQLAKLLQPYLQAGHPPDSPPEPHGRKGQGKGRKISRESLEWGKGIRAFAKQNGYSYTTSTGKLYYSALLRDAYARHLENAGGREEKP
jgi:hypothetical protein